MSLHPDGLPSQFTQNMQQHENPKSQQASSSHSPGGVASSSVPEFLYQLSRMLTDNNREIIEWANGTYGHFLLTSYTCCVFSGRKTLWVFLHLCLKKAIISSFYIAFLSGKIEVHSPNRLESEVLKRYFRHSKFPSFQRQLNYFGFRKLAGKGKMAPCSYVNDQAGRDVNSLLNVKVCNSYES
jgi:HSF-type DNA-binding